MKYHFCIGFSRFDYDDLDEVLNDCKNMTSIRCCKSNVYDSNDEVIATFDNGKKIYGEVL